MSGFLPPVVMTIIADAKKFIDEQGRVVGAADAASKKVIEAAEKEAAATEAAAAKQTEAAAKKAEAAASAARAVEEASAKVAEAEAAAARATEESEAKAVAAVEAATAKLEAAKAREAEAVGASAKAEQDATRLTEEAAAKRSAATGLAAGATAGHWKSMGKTALTTGAVMAGASLAVGIGAIDMAAKFEKSTTLLVTAGGEAQSSLKTVQDGILTIARDTGTSAEQLSSGMYLLEKAGFDAAHGGLDVLRTAAQGAKAEGVDLQTMTGALTDVMLNYHLGADKAASTTNMMVKAAGEAKTTMQEFAGAMGALVPVGAKAGLGFDQLGGALATITQHGVSAEQGAQNLAHAITMLQSPSNVQIQQMAAMGINAQDLSANLGKRGLTGTMEDVYNSIMQHMGPGGLVLQNAFNQSKSAGADLQTMIAHMPPHLAELAKGFLDNKVSMKDFQKGFKDMGAQGDAQGKQFLALANQAEGFNNVLKSGSPEAQTFTAALSKMMGGQDGLRVALMLTGANMEKFKGNVEGISEAGQQNGKDIETWGQTSQTLAVKWDQLKESAAVLGVELGQALMPVAKAALDMFKGFMDWANANPDGFKALAIGIGAVSLAFGVLAVAAGIAAIAMMPHVLLIGGIVLAIVALGAAIAWLVTHWNEVTAFIKQVWDGFVGWLRGIMEALAGWWHSWWDPFAATVAQVWGAIVEVGKWALGILLAAVLIPIQIALNVLGAVWNWLYTSIIKPVWDNILNAITFAWNWLSANVFKPLGDAIAVMGVLWNWYWHNVVEPVWNGIQQVISAVWLWIKGNVVDAIATNIRTMGDQWTWLQHNVIEPVWAAIQKAMGDAWNWLSSNVFSPIGQALDAMGKGFDIAQQIIGAAWDKIKEAARGPVAFIVDTVYRDGIKKVWDGVSDALHVGSHLPDPPPGFASGGVAGIMPGYTPGRDVYTIAVSGGEAIMRPEWTRMVGPARVHAMNRAAAAGNTSAVHSMMGFADGGVVGDVLGNIGSFVGDVAGKIGSFFTDPLGSIAKLIGDPVKGLIGQIAGSPWGQMLGGMATSMVGNLGTWVKGLVDGMAKAGGGGAPGTPVDPGSAGAGVQQWAPLVLQALAMTGQPADLLGTTLRRMNQESGGNPNAVNNWDINAINGDPSRGLMQVIGSTFAAYAAPGYNQNIYDPMSNILASMNYAIARYGSLAGAYNQPGGYALGGIAPVLMDTGGWLPPGRSIVDNHTGQHERVLPPGRSGADGTHIEVNVHTGANPYQIAEEIRWAVRSY